MPDEKPAIPEFLRAWAMRAIVGLLVAVCAQYGYDLNIEDPAEQTARDEDVVRLIKAVEGLSAEIRSDHDRLVRLEALMERMDAADPVSIPPVARPVTRELPDFAKIRVDPKEIDVYQRSRK